MMKVKPYYFMLCEVSFFFLSLTCSSLKHDVLLEILIQNSTLYKLFIRSNG